MQASATQNAPPSLNIDPSVVKLLLRELFEPDEIGSFFKTRLDHSSRVHLFSLLNDAWVEHTRTSTKPVPVPVTNYLTSYRKNNPTRG